MRLTTKGRYAVVAMVDIAANCCGGKPITLAEIADRQGISLSYLEQLFCKLRRAGLVKSARGPGGGYCLLKAASDTRIAEIVLAVDEPMLGDPCADSVVGPTDLLWRTLSSRIETFLGSVSVADVLAGRLELPAATEPLRAAG